MRGENKFSSRHIIVTLICAIIGILLIWLGVSIDNSLFSNIGSVLLISGIYTVVDNMYLKKALVEMVVQKVNLKKEINDTGLIKTGSVLSNIEYQEFLENATSNIDIVHNYARTWTDNNFEFVKNTVMNKNCQLRVVLLNPNSPFVPALSKHYKCTSEDLAGRIKDACNRWSDLYHDVGKKRKEHPNKSCGTVELYYFNGQPTNSLYRIDNKLIVVTAKNSNAKSIYSPYAIYEQNDEKGLYNIYLNEIEAIINDATKVDLTAGNNFNM